MYLKSLNIDKNLIKPCGHLQLKVERQAK